MGYYPWAEVVLKSERAVIVGAYMVDKQRPTGRLSLYPPLLIDWIRKVGVEVICEGPDGVEPMAGESWKPCWS